MSYWWTRLRGEQDRVAEEKYRKGGEKGLTINEASPITSVREFVGSKQYGLDAKVTRSFLTSDLGEK